MGLSEQVVMYRATHNMTQREFAAHAGISLRTVCKVETDENVKLTKVVHAKIVIALADKTGGVKNEFV